MTAPSATPASDEAVGVDEETVAVLRRLKDALPTVGLNGWIRGVQAIDAVLAALSAPAALGDGPGIDPMDYPDLPQSDGFINGELAYTLTKARAYAHAFSRAALSARTAAPAEQGGYNPKADPLFLAELADAMLHVKPEPGAATGAARAWFLNGWLSARARLAPIAPDARSVDGLSGEYTQVGWMDEQGFKSLEKYGSGSVTDSYCPGDTPLFRRLAGAKVQDGGE